MFPIYPEGKQEHPSPSPIRSNLETATVPRTAFSET